MRPRPPWQDTPGRGVRTSLLPKVVPLRGQLLFQGVASPTRIITWAALSRKVLQFWESKTTEERLRETIYLCAFGQRKEDLQKLKTDTAGFPWRWQSEGGGNDFFFIFPLLKDLFIYSSLRYYISTTKFPRLPLLPLLHPHPNLLPFPDPLLHFPSEESRPPWIPT